MPEKILTTDPPQIDEEDFEDYLATDDLFVDYFNTFLGLPSFPEPIRFNTETGGFEVVTSAKHEIAEKIKAAARAQQTPRPQTAASRFYSRDDDSGDEEIKTNFSVQCLDKEQGIQWIREERLPSFLQSDLYMEYRLSKLLSQVETSPGGMKLTIDPDFRPWYKPKIKPESPPPVNETEVMIQRMFVTLGSTPVSQSKEWFSMAKQSEADSMTMTPSRPLSSATVTTGAWARPPSSCRPSSVQSTRYDPAEDSSRFFDSAMWTGTLTDQSHGRSASHKSKTTVTFDEEGSFGGKMGQLPKESASVKKLDFSAMPEIIPPTPNVPLYVDDAACILPESSSSEGKVGKVARIEPEDSDDESDQGMGSECESSIDESLNFTNTTSRTKETESAEYGLELRSLEDYASVLVALSLKNALLSISDTTADNLDSVSAFEEIIPKPKDWLLGLRGAKGPVPISKLDEQMFAEAILAQERRVLEDTGRLSRKSKLSRQSKSSKVSTVQTGGDILDLLEAPKKKITFDETIPDTDRSSKSLSSASSETDEQDSVFSDKSDSIDSRYAVKTQRYDFVDVKGFAKFKEFVKGTMGDVVIQLWMDVDRSRYAVPKHGISSFLNKLRQKYLTVGSVNLVSKELLKKWGIEHASQWTIKKLRAAQRDMAEPLLLYWAPRFLIRQSSAAQQAYNVAIQSHKPQKRLLMRDVRPMSSQTYPTPKTVIIRPLRPKSCLPRIKVKPEKDKPKPEKPVDKNVPETREENPYHIMGMYQQITYHPKYQHQMYHTLKFKSHETPIKMPKSLFPEPKKDVPRFESTRKYLQQLRAKNKRPLSAGPSGGLTMGTLAIFEKKERAKSAHETSLPHPPAYPKKATTKHAIDSQSVTSERTVSSTVTHSTLRGSEPMESMLQALYYDTRAGWFFTRYCEQSNNKDWRNAIHFWFDTQDFHNLFYNNIFNAFVVQRKAQIIYSTYIVVGSPEDIGVSMMVRKRIHKNLEPAFDELFDAAEEYVLKLLIVPWNMMLGADQASYRKVELIEQERNLQVASKYLSFLQKKGIIKEQPRTLSSDMRGEEKYEEDLWEKVPEEFRDYTFDELVRNRMELEHFKKFLEENYAKTDLLFWLDIESFKRVPHQAAEKRDEKAKDIRTKYLHKKYFFGPSSPANKEQQNKVVQASGGWGMTLKERPPTEMILEAQKYVKNRLTNRWLPRFLATVEFQDRQRPKSQMSDVAEDVILQKKKKRGEPWKLLDNRWQTSSRELVEFRHALANPVTSGQFRRYVSIKGDLLENDVLFWLEVQKYKDFCHSHNEQAAIDAKVGAIIHCFLDSQIPPTIQIDIPTEMAERIMEKRRELGPYVFREAQLTVFRVLFPHWAGFCEFRKNLTDEKLTRTLERQRARKMERVRLMLVQQHNEQVAKEEAAAAREREEAENAQSTVDPLADILSSAGSDITGSGPVFDRGLPSNQLRWSYGKYIEALNKERQLLLMENELTGRIPAEALREVDEDVTTKDSDSVISDTSSEDVGSSITASEMTGSAVSQAAERHKKRRKKMKEKVIYSTISEVAKGANGHAADEASDRVKVAGKSETVGSGKKSAPGKGQLRNGKDKEEDATKKPVIVVD